MSSSRVRSAERVLSVLDLLTRRVAPMATAEISAALDLPKSTTHHLLNVMHDMNYVAYWPDRRVWSLGISTFEVGAAYLRTGHLQHQGQRHLSALTARTGQTSHLAVLQGSDVLYLDKREPQNSGVRLVTDVGTRLPAHLTAVGRALLSRLSEAEVRDTYADYDWPRRTDVTITSPEELLAVLAEVATNGYAVELGTTTSGIECVAAPVLAGGGVAVAAIGVAMAAGAHGVEIDEIATQVRAAATTFSESLGHVS